MNKRKKLNFVYVEDKSKFKTIETVIVHERRYNIPTLKSDKVTSEKQIVIISCFWFIKIKSV